jgi:hypothetical protein
VASQPTLGQPVLCGFTVPIPEVGLRLGSTALPDTCSQENQEQYKVRGEKQGLLAELDPPQIAAIDGRI